MKKASFLVDTHLSEATKPWRQHAQKQQVNELTPPGQKTPDSQVQPLAQAKPSLVVGKEKSVNPTQNPKKSDYVIEDLDSQTSTTNFSRETQQFNFRREPSIERKVTSTVQGELPGNYTVGNRNLVAGIGGSYDVNLTKQSGMNLHIPENYTRPKKEPAKRQSSSSGSDQEFNESVYEQSEKIDDILESHDEILDLHMKILKVGD